MERFKFGDRVYCLSMDMGHGAVVEECPLAVRIAWDESGLCWHNPKSIALLPSGKGFTPPTSTSEEDEVAQWLDLLSSGVGFQPLLPGFDAPTEKQHQQTVMPEKRCECGVDSVGYGHHSSWCPKVEN